MGRASDDEDEEFKESNYLLKKKNGMQTVAMVTPNHLKKCSGGISVIPNTDWISPLAMNVVVRSGESGRQEN